MNNIDKDAYINELKTVIADLTIENKKLKNYIEHKDDKANKTLFSEYLKEWLETYKYRWQITTYEGYRRIVYNHLVPYFEENKIYIEDLTYEDLDTYYNYKISTGLSANTIIRHHANIRLALKEAVKKKIIDTNPASFATPPSATKPNIDYYNINQLLLLLSVFRETPLYPVVLLCSLGLRRSEALAITISDIDFDSKLLKINKKIVPTKDNQINTIPLLKTQSSLRNIALPDFYISELKYIIKNRPTRKKDFLCLNEENKLFTPSSASHGFYKIIKENHLPHITLKGLRHTCACIINAQGYNLDYVKDWLGHSTIKLTADTYSHLSTSEKYAIADSLNQAFISDT